MGKIILINSVIDNISWQNATQFGFAPGEAVDVWKISVDQNLTSLDTFSSVLTDDELIRARKYLRQEDHDRFIISRGSLRFILSGYLDEKPDDIRFQSGYNHKPFIVQQKDIHFNLSDSADMVMVAVAKSEIGMDVEYIKPEFHYEDILPLNFNPPEIDFIMTDDRLRRFFLLWTRKEALLKATGIGLTDYLTAIQSLEGEYLLDGNLINTQNNWQINSFIPQDGYIASVCTGLPVPQCNFVDFNHCDLSV